MQTLKASLQAEENTLHAAPQKAWIYHAQIYSLNGDNTIYQEVFGRVLPT